MKVEVVERPEATRIVAGRFCLCFAWTGDRWTHRLETADGLVLATAHESAEEGLPVSPTYQDLHVEAGADHATAMGLGRYGHHHYSATFRVGERSGLCIDVDVADRGQDDSPLAATYTVHRPPGDLEYAAETGVAWSLEADTALVLERHPDDVSSRVSTAEAGRAACRAQVLAGATASQKRTRRLRYTWMIANPTSDLEPVEP